MKKKTQESLKNLFIADIKLLNSDPSYVGEVLNMYDGSSIEQTQKEGNELVNKLLLRAKIEAKTNTLNDKIEKAKALLKKVKESSENELSNIQEFFNSVPSSYQLNFRDLKDFDEDDAINILKDIKLLEKLDDLDNEDL